MPRLQQYQSNFSLGAIDPLLRGRIDLQQYYSALETAKNVLIEPQGGFSRRAGLKFIQDLTSDNASNGVMLIPFEFSTTQNFLIVASAYNTTNTIRFRFYVNQTLITNINSSGNSYLDYNVGTLYSVSNFELKKLYFTQNTDTLICVHENMQPFSIVRGTANNLWTISALTLVKPKAQFTKATTNPSATITPDETDGTVNITASSGVFASSNVDQYINVLNGFGRARIIEFTSSTVVKAVTETPFFEKDVAIASGAWELETGYEDAWSGTRGYPRTCTFHEGRLYFGGSATLPSTLFASKVGQFFDFKQDEGLDDDALQVTLTTDNVNGHLEQRTAMLSGVSHDLRTPLTRMKLSMSLMEKDDLVDDLMGDVEEMEGIVNEFLAFSRGDTGEEFTIVDPKKLIKPLIKERKRLNHNISLDLDNIGSDKINFKCKSLAMSRAINNLLSNAAKYSNKTLVTVTSTEKTLSFIVEDSGKGIPKELRYKAIKPFERLDKSRNQNEGIGAGLGLAIVSDIARSHGGKLILSHSNNLGGLKAEIQIPI